MYAVKQSNFVVLYVLPEVTECQ